MKQRTITIGGKSIATNEEWAKRFLSGTKESDRAVRNFFKGFFKGFTTNSLYTHDRIIIDDVFYDFSFDTNSKTFYCMNLSECEAIETKSIDCLVDYICRYLRG